MIEIPCFDSDDCESIFICEICGEVSKKDYATINLLVLCKSCERENMRQIGIQALGTMITPEDTLKSRLVKFLHRRRNYVIRRKEMEKLEGIELYRRYAELARKAKSNKNFKEFSYYNNKAKRLLKKGL
jgi:hypothetical protein